MADQPVALPLTLRIATVLALATCIFFLLLLACGELYAFVDIRATWRLDRVFLGLTWCFWIGAVATAVATPVAAIATHRLLARLSANRH